MRLTTRGGSGYEDLFARSSLHVSITVRPTRLVLYTKRSVSMNEVLVYRRTLSRLSPVSLHTAHFVLYCTDAESIEAFLYLPDSSILCRKLYVPRISTADTGNTASEPVQRRLSDERLDDSFADSVRRKSFP